MLPIFTRRLLHPFLLPVGLLPHPRLGLPQLLQDGDAPGQMCIRDSVGILSCSPFILLRYNGIKCGTEIK